MRQRFTPTAYLLVLLATTGIVFLTIWAWVIYKPMSYLDGVYPQWTAGDASLKNCDLGELAVLGDSRVGIGVIPLDLPIAATVLAQPGAGPLEAAYIAERIARCPVRPRRVLISINMHLFTAIDSWDNTIRIGLLPGGTVQAIRRVGDSIGDNSLDLAPSHDGLPHAMRAWAYSVRFPPIFLGSLINGLLIGREARNRQILATIVATRGHVAFSGLPEWHGVSVEGRLAVFRPLPILDTYFGRAIATLQKAGIEVDFATMPVNEETYDAMPATVRDTFAAYLAGYADRYSSFHVLGNPLPRWPGGYFGDAALHLNPLGEKVLTRQLADCLTNEAADMATTCALGRVPDDGPADPRPPPP